VVVPLQTPEQISQHFIKDFAANAELVRAADIKLE
jgi:hypothetical protein